jgi:hypothetical protein
MGDMLVLPEFNALAYSMPIDKTVGNSGSNDIWFKSPWRGRHAIGDDYGVWVSKKDLMST